MPHDASWIVGSSVGYRNRIRLAVVDGVPQFFNAEKALGCVVLEPSLQDAMNSFLQWAAAYRQALRPFKVAEVRAVDADGNAAVYLRHTERNGAPSLAPDNAGIPRRFPLGLVAFEGGTVEYQRTFVSSDVWLWSPVGGFGQVNTLVNQGMVQTVVDWLRARYVLTVLDLFSGSGNFSVPLRAAGVCGTAVEWDPVGCQAHERTLQSHGFHDVSVIRGDALEHAAGLVNAGRRFDAVVLDPPRRGLRGNVDAVVQVVRDVVVLVSCNAEQFAKDAAAFGARGFRIADYRLVDMFPHTDHVELIACFERV